MASEKKRLIKEINFLRKHLKPLERKLDRITLREKILKASELVGNCYVYKQSYADSEEWKLYRKITGLTTDGSIKILSLEKAPHGIEISESTIYCEANLGLRIEPTTFDLQFKKFIGQLKGSITRTEKKNEN